MPRKRMNTRKPKRVVRKSFRRRRQGAYSSTKINIRPSMHMPLAERYTCNVTCDFYGFIGSTGLATNKFYVIPTFMSPHYDINVGQTPFLQMTGAELIPATISLQNLSPIFWSALTGMYTKVVTNHSTLSVNFTPTAAADILQLVVYPWKNSILDSTEEAMSQPYAKSIICTGNNNIKQNTVRSKITWNKLLGMTKQEYFSIWANDYNDQGSTNQSTPTYGHAIVYQLFSGSTVTSNIAVQVKYSMNITLYDPVGTNTGDNA